VALIVKADSTELLVEAFVALEVSRAYFVSRIAAHALQNLRKNRERSWSLM